jgi:RNA methyltransferase, TrmH family
LGELITSARNSRVVWTRKLRQRKHRQAERCFLAEGLQLIHMGLASGRRPRAVFCCEELFSGPGAPSLLERCRQSGTDVLSVSPAVLSGLSERDAVSGLLAVFPFFDVGLEQLRWDGDALVLVLDRLQNPGNVGTLVRTADAVGAAAVVLLEPGADPYDPTAVRSSMGSLFNLPLIRCADASALFQALARLQLPVIGADPYSGVLWNQASWPGRAALLLGNEARGMSDDVRTQIQSWVRLPMVGRAESLNVSVVGGVLMYGWLAARRASGSDDVAANQSAGRTDAQS